MTAGFPCPSSEVQTPNGFGLLTYEHSGFPSLSKGQRRDARDFSASVVRSEVGYPNTSASGFRLDATLRGTEEGYVGEEGINRSVEVPTPPTLNKWHEKCPCERPDIACEYLSLLPEGGKSPVSRRGGAEPSWKIESTWRQTPHRWEAYPLEIGIGVPWNDGTCLYSNAIPSMGTIPVVLPFLRCSFRVWRIFGPEE
jgi:hypothetical protein